MSKDDKIIKKILAGGQVSYQEAERLLLKLDFQIKISASHHVFRKKGYPYNISIKLRPQLLKYQIKILQKILMDHGYEESN